MKKAEERCLWEENREIAVARNGKWSKKEQVEEEEEEQVNWEQENSEEEEQEAASGVSARMLDGQSIHTHTRIRRIENEANVREENTNTI